MTEGRINKFSTPRMHLKFEEGEVQPDEQLGADYVIETQKSAETVPVSAEMRTLVEEYAGRNLEELGEIKLMLELAKMVHDPIVIEKLEQKNDQALADEISKVLYGLETKLRGGIKTPHGSAGIPTPSSVIH